jgi:hypothetical protein
MQSVRLVLHLGLLLLVSRLAESSAPAQEPTPAFDRLFLTKPRIDFDSTPFAFPDRGSARLPLFGSSFLQPPLDVLDEDFGQSPLDVKPDEPGTVFALGAYRPNFDFRPTGERRPLGYYKVYSQMQLGDVGATSVYLTVQGMTPSDGDLAGVSRGPTSVNPAIGWFHDLGDGVALQGSFGQDILAHTHWSEGFGTRLQCALGVQYPIPGVCNVEAGQGWYFFFQARGYYRYEDTSDGVWWKVFPGLHWRAGDDCWLSLSASRHSLVSLLFRF